MRKSPSSCKPLCHVDVRNLIKWVADIDPSYFEKVTSDRPLVIADGRWMDMADMTAPVMMDVMEQFPGYKADGPQITTVHPGDYVPHHVDSCPPGWFTRIHVPLITNKDAVMITEGKEHHLEVGTAYTFDISKPHAIRNAGNASRIHLMFDVVQ